MTEIAKTPRPRIYGSAGDDTMGGTSDADTMCGGLGNDSYVVNNIGDFIIEYAGQGYDTVYASIDYKLEENVEKLVLTGKAVSGIGNALDNVIEGNAASNVIDGGKGADEMRGGLGDDTYFVDDARDRVIEFSNEGTDTVYASVSYALPASWAFGAWDPVRSTYHGDVENLVLTGTAPINATGNFLANVLVGNSGANVLDGGTGADE